MSKLRALLPPTSAPASLSDTDMIAAVATMVHLGQATLKFSSPEPGELPWPDILRDLGRADFEGTVTHLYADTVGKVTVGVGTMLASVAEAQALGFVVRKTGKPATATEIAADYASVQAQYRTTRTSGLTLQPAGTALLATPDWREHLAFTPRAALRRWVVLRPGVPTSSSSASPPKPSAAPIRRQGCFCCARRVVARTSCAATR